MPRADRVLYVRVPAGLADRVAGLAGSEGMSVNAWCARELLRAAVRHDTPHHTTPHDAPPVTIVDVIRHTTERTPLVAPCGRPWPCPDQDRTELAGTAYCGTCGVKLP